MFMSAVVKMLKIWPPLLCALSSSGKTQQERAGSPQARNAREMEEKRFWQHVGEWNLFQVHWGVKAISLFGRSCSGGAKCTWASVSIPLILTRSHESPLSRVNLTPNYILKKFTNFTFRRNGF
jgi:hypothetical protein